MDDKLKIDPELTRELDAGAAGPFQLLVTFQAAPAAGELLSLGLQGEGEQAFGVLDAAAVRALAARPDVTSIVRVPAPSAGPPGPSGPPHSKLDLRLSELLAGQPEGSLGVLVRFHRTPPREELLALGLAAEPGSTIAAGQLEPRRILALAGRDDVAAIEAAPEMNLYSTP